MQRLKPAGFFHMIVGFAEGLSRIHSASLSVPRNPSSPPTAEPIVADYNRALGGEEKYHKFEMRVTKAVHAAEAWERPFITRHDADDFFC